jgi:hypothetical protein
MYKVKSETIPGKVYTVRHTNTGQWRCNCLDFLTRERFKGICKHISKILLKEK